MLLWVRITRVPSSELDSQHFERRDHVLWGVVPWPGRWLRPSVGYDEQTRWVWGGRMDASCTQSCHVPSLSIQTPLRGLQLSTDHGRTGSLLASYVGHSPGAPFWLLCVIALAVWKCEMYCSQRVKIEALHCVLFQGTAGQAVCMFRQDGESQQET